MVIKLFFLLKVPYHLKGEFVIKNHEIQFINLSKIGIVYKVDVLLIV